MSNLSNSESFSLVTIGVIRSVLKQKEDAPLFYTEGAPDAWLEIFPPFTEAFHRMEAGDDIIIITWLHQANRDTLKVHPRGNPAHPLTGVFSTRSPDRPNPLELHRAKILEIKNNRLHIDAIEAIDGTPVVDIKAVVSAIDY